MPFQEGFAYHPHPRAHVEMKTFPLIGVPVEAGRKNEGPQHADLDERLGQGERHLGTCEGMDERTSGLYMRGGPITDKQ